MLAFPFPQLSESKIRRFRARQERAFPTHHSSDYYHGKTTPLSELAHDFDRALIAVNQNKDDIHIGHLLAACERLESTIRRTGFGTSANDIATNIAKVRSTYEKVPSSERDSMSVLLKYEKDAGMHRNRKIKESSATMGLLWLGRSINYQHDMFRYMLDHPQASPYDAASKAYAATVKPYLSWPLQKLGQAALKGTRSTNQQTILARMGGVQEDRYNQDIDSATKKDLNKVVESWNPIIRRWKQVFVEMGMEGL
jgi:hypothetical protein